MILIRPSILISGIFVVFVLFSAFGCGEKSTPSPIAPPPVAPGISAGETVELEPMFPAAPTAGTESQPTPASEPQPTDAPSTEPASEPQPAEATSTEPVTLRQVQPQAPYAALFAAEDVRYPQAADLEPQVEAYLKKLENALSDLDGTVDYNADAEALRRDANTLSLIALALGMTDEDNKYKNAAPGIIQACLKLRAAKKYDEAVQCFDDLKKSLSSSSDAKLQWTKIAELPPIMKAVPLINSLVKRSLRTEAALKKDGAKRVAQGTAVLAVIAQGSLPNVEETIKPQAAKEWKEQCLSFRDIALELNERTNAFSAGKASYEEVEASFEKLTAACDACHVNFYSGTVPKID